jgi:ubiquitin carboxyl-terminal hydrolase 34
MISMLQQFFMIAPFRHGLLLASDGLAHSCSEHKGHLFDDNVLHQLQLIYTKMLRTSRKDVQITDFCLSFKDWDGQPVDVTIQQDAF